MSLLWIAVLFLTCEPLKSNSQGLFDCRNRNTTVLLANKHAEVDITHTDRIRLTWERVKSGNRLIITTTEDVNITTIRTKKLLIHASVNCGGTACSASVQKASMLIWISYIFALHKFGVLNSYTIFLMLLLYFSSTSISTFEECSRPRVHIKIPTSFVSKVCINSNRCIETSCDLGLYLDDNNNKGYSILDSDNEVLFRKDTCEIIKPKYWDDWIYLNLGINDTSGGLLYYADDDGDGLVNILEYYANTNVTEPLMPNRARRSTSFDDFLKNLGSNPKNPDSDHDLLLDGYEFINNLSPVVQDDSNEDLDGDLLSNLNEQIHQTDPLNPDTDGDGVNDGTEINNYADPIDPSDQGRSDYSDSFAIMRLTVGDPSGSHSERYNLNVGDISHQSPGFGLVGSGKYKFLPGTYTITVNWIATNIWSGIPDYDYTARVQIVTSKNVDVQVKDDGSILGTYYDNNFDRTIGKKSRLIIKSKCQNDEAACYKDCESCESSLFRVWDPIRQVCKSRGFRFQSGCPCAECLKWYDEEIKDTKWLKDLNRNFPCPCKWIDLESGSASQAEKDTWEADQACRKNGDGDWWFKCSDYHPGAYGCIRSINSGSYAQQCCYDFNLDWIQSGKRGAGTPDKVSSSESKWRHKTADVDTYTTCCKKCGSLCHLYINGVRKGPKSCTAKLSM